MNLRNLLIIIIKFYFKNNKKNLLMFNKLIEKEFVKQNLKIKLQKKIIISYVKICNKTYIK